MSDESVNQESICNMLDMIPQDVNGLERAVLCTDGTVQTLLSAIFYAPVRVDVKTQVDYDTEIMRTVELIAMHSNENEHVVCKAWSVIQKKGSSPGFLTGIQEQNMGIGQLISTIGINTNRIIMSMDSSKKYLTRHYEIKEIPDSVYAKDILNIDITEQFPRELYAIKGV